MRLAIILLLIPFYCYSQDRDEMFNASVKADSLGHHTKALFYLNKLISEDSSNFDYYRQRALVRSKLELFSASDSDYCKALMILHNQMKEESGTALDMRTYSFAATLALRGINRYEMGYVDEACEDFNKSIEYGYSEALKLRYDICR